MAPSARDDRSTPRRASDLVPVPSGAGARMGRVSLVGAGPGAADLLTLRAVERLRSADVVVHDRLVSEEALGHAPATARRIYVGKQKARHALPQPEINALLIGLARSGLDVVRLKGGDPFVFGRGGEELLACRAAGVPCEVTPGVSAAVAASAAAGAPLTHRGLAQAVTLVTGHAASEADGGCDPDLDWPALARPNQTVAVYMGLSAAAAVATRLTGAGRAPSTPVLIVENVSHPDERRALATLATLGDAARDFTGPAVLLIGETAALADVASAESAEPQMARARA
ncbi:MAG: uroporphyrinogen-III C-methyltransferase [Caulobacteraceae bacterium]|nr:uroporphyrinogen-III C-methyltransferase [Caulobacter sp.]